MKNIKSFIATGSAVNRIQSFFPLTTLLQQARLLLFVLLSAGSAMGIASLLASHSPKRPFPFSMWSISHSLFETFWCCFLSTEYVPLIQFWSVKWRRLLT